METNTPSLIWKNNTPFIEKTPIRICVKKIKNEVSQDGIIIKYMKKGNNNNLYKKAS